jgi:hypothetical protein
MTAIVEKIAAYVIPGIKGSNGKQKRHPYGGVFV